MEAPRSPTPGIHSNYQYLLLLIINYLYLLVLFQDFKYTIIQSGGEVVMCGGGTTDKKRERKVPDRYRDTLYNEEIDLLGDTQEETVGRCKSPPHPLELQRGNLICL